MTKKIFILKFTLTFVLTFFYNCKAEIVTGTMYRIGDYGRWAIAIINEHEVKAARYNIANIEEYPEIQAHGKLVRFEAAFSQNGYQINELMSLYDEEKKEEREEPVNNHNALRCDQKFISMLLGLIPRLY